MRSEEVLPLRMASLLLGSLRAGAQTRTAGNVVEWFGAMQAQDLASGEWSFGVRMPGSIQRDIEQATIDRTIMRTWPMRGTVHFVPPRDALWMLELTGVRALRGAEGRRAQLGLTEAIVTKAAETLEAAMIGGKRLTRTHCVDLLIEAGVHTAKEHGYHLLWYASQIGVTCIGPQQGREQTFALLKEWVPNPRILSRDEALAELALRYFRSHGPTTQQDFAGWTGLTAADARKAISMCTDCMCTDQLTTVEVDGAKYVLAASLRDDAQRIVADQVANRMHLLPGFDEYLLGFKERSLMLKPEHKQLIIPGSNGVFMPTIVWDGRVIGTWRREIKKSRVEVRAHPFELLTEAQHAAFAVAAADYGRYLQREVDLLS